MLTKSDSHNKYDSFIYLTSPDIAPPRLRPDGKIVFQPDANC